MTVTIFNAEFAEVFARCWVVNIMVNLIEDTDNQDLLEINLVEPFVESAAFFMSVIERLLASLWRPSFGS